MKKWKNWKNEKIIMKREKKIKKWKNCNENIKMKWKMKREVWDTKILRKHS